MASGPGGAPQGGARADPPLCSMPLERAIAWGRAPDGDEPSRPSAHGRIFFTPNVMRDMTAYVMRDGAGSLGYFAGQRFRDPDSNEPWVLADAVIPVVKQSVKTPMPALLDATIEQARAQARAAGREVVGWYHSAARSQPVLTRSDGEAHERHFAKSNAFMLMIAIGRHERQAALFRPSLERGSVPFFELLESEVTPGDGAAATVVSWTNYLTIDAAPEEPSRTSGSQRHAVEPPAPRATPPAAEPPPSQHAPPPRAPQWSSARPSGDPPPRESGRRDARQPAPDHPDSWMPTFSAGTPDDELEVPPARAGARGAKPTREGRPPRRGAASPQPSSNREPAAFQGGKRRRRVSLKPLVLGGLATAAVVAVVVIAGKHTPALWSDRGEAAPSSLDVAADFAESEVLRYRSTARSFDDGRVSCDDLGRVLVSVDEAWIAYSLERAAASEPLDPAGVERERRLEGDVVEIERHFQVTECPRP